MAKIGVREKARNNHEAISVQQFKVSLHDGIPLKKLIALSGTYSPSNAKTSEYSPKEEAEPQAGLQSRDLPQFAARNGGPQVVGKKELRDFPSSDAWPGKRG